MGLRRDLSHARHLPLRTWGDLATAVIELGLARIRLAKLDPAKLLAPGPSGGNAAASSSKDTDTIERIAFAIPRMGARVPWKGTCLVQALAARRWLARRGIASEIVLGARKDNGSGLDAHAWLVAGGRTIVGGDPAGYEPFAPSRRT